MAFPYLFHENFEGGTIGDFNTETDTGARLAVTHYSELARLGNCAMPWRGAYAVRVDLAKSVDDAFLQENDGFDTALDGSIEVKFKMWVSPDITMANNDEFVIFALQSTGPVSEVVIVINYTTANGLRIGVGATSGVNFLQLQTGQWLDVELSVTIDDGASNDGTAILRVNGVAATTLSGQDQAAIIQASFGVIGQDAGTTAGTILFDHIMADDTRIYPTHNDQRWDYNQVVLADNQHLFVGRGCLENIQLVTAGTDNVLQCWDTDTGNTNDLNRLKVELKTSTATEIVDPAGMPVKFTRGCYVVITGTTAAKAIARIGFVAAWGEANVRRMSRITG